MCVIPLKKHHKDLVRNEALQKNIFLIKCGDGEWEIKMSLRVKLEDIIIQCKKLYGPDDWDAMRNQTRRHNTRVWLTDEMNEWMNQSINQWIKQSIRICLTCESKTDRKPECRKHRAAIRLHRVQKKKPLPIYFVQFRLWEENDQGLIGLFLKNFQARTSMQRAPKAPIEGVSQCKAPRGEPMF